MRVRLEGTALVYGNSSGAVPNVARRLIVSDNDYATYCVVDIDEQSGAFKVDFELEGVGHEGYVTDFIKFFFFTSDRVPVHIASGGVHVARLVKDSVHKFRNNFQPVTVSVVIRDCDPLSAEGLARSMLRTPVREIVVPYVDQIDKTIAKRALVKDENGGHMFSNVLAMHDMQDQATSHLHYQVDFCPTPYVCERYWRTGITMSCLVETLRLTRHTIPEINALDNSAPEFTRFVSMVCEACMRSARVCPYTPDQNVVVDKNGEVRLVPGESFKRPFAEPFDGAHLHAMQNDDCEGEALWLLQMLWSFAFLRDDECFPEHLFDLTDAQKEQLVQLARRIGNLVEAERLTCEITLVSASAAALGNSSASHITGHAACVLTNRCYTEAGPHSILMEGTNCIYPEIYDAKCTINNSELTISQLANAFTRRMRDSSVENMDPTDVRCMFHLDVVRGENMPFYRNCFIQDQKILCRRDDKTYGVSVGDLNKRDAVQSVGVLNPQSEKQLRDVLAKRRIEGHAPLAPVSKVLDATRHWSKQTLWELPSQDQQYLPCLYTHAVEDPVLRAQRYADARIHCDEFNKKMGTTIGVADCFCAFDSVYHVLYLKLGNLDKICEFVGKPSA